MDRDETENKVLAEAIEKARITQTDLSKEIGRAHNYLNILIRQNISPSQEIQNAIQIALGKRGVYLDTLEAWPVKDNNVTLRRSDMKSRSFRAYKRSQEEPLVTVHLENAKYLPARYRKALNLRAAGHTLQSIGKKLGYTKERVRQLLKIVAHCLMNTEYAKKRQSSPFMRMKKKP